LNFLYYIYFALPGFDRFGLPGKAINRIMLIILKRIFDLFIPYYLIKTSQKQETGINLTKREETYIVSLTSFPARINDIWITIETILRQSFKPDRIILWLAEEQFPDKKLPESLTRLKERGLRIDFCKDLKSHKKYYYSMLNYSESNIITLDDDLYYPHDLLKNVVQLHKKNPDLVTTNRAHRITFTGKMINPYRKWKHNVTDTIPSHFLVATGGAGTLYPPGALPEETFNEDLIKELCFNADDLWLKVMELKNNTMVVTNDKYNKSFVSVASTQKHKLSLQNVINRANDLQFNDLLHHFDIDLFNMFN